MKIEKKSSIKHQHSPECTVYEYPFESQDINVAFVELKGKNPPTGYALNQKVKEFLFITQGEGKIVLEETSYELKK